MKIYLVRHPETIANRDGIIYGWKDYPYSEKGQLMLENIPGYFKDIQVDEIYSSPIGRAEKLAAAISLVVNRDLKIDERLKEMNFGVLEGAFFDNLDEKQTKILEEMYENFETFQVPEGESCLLVQNRVKPFFEELLRGEKPGPRGKKTEKGEQPREKTVVVVAHAMLIQMVLVNFLGIDIKKAWNFKLKPGMIIKIKAHEDFASIEEMVTYETLFSGF